MTVVTSAMMVIYGSETPHCESHYLKIRLNICGSKLQVKTRSNHSTKSYYFTKWEIGTPKVEGKMVSYGNGRVDGWQLSNT